jgi:hypothetical protein
MTSLTHLRKRGLKMENFQAVAWVRQHTTKITTMIRGESKIVAFRPSTAELRRLLHDPKTPRGVKGHLYVWLEYRSRH